MDNRFSVLRLIRLTSKHAFDWYIPKHCLHLQLQVEDCRGQDQPYFNTLAKRKPGTSHILHICDE